MPMPVSARPKTRLSSEKRDAIRLRFKRANQNLRWFADHYPEVKRAHAGRFVVVWRADVVASGKTLKSATTAARRKDIPVEDALLQYVPSKGETFVF